jgi:hypothetical protein
MVENMNERNQLYSGYNNQSAGKNVKEGDSNGEPLKLEEPKREGYPTAEAVKTPTFRQEMWV